MTNLTLENMDSCLISVWATTSAKPYGSCGALSFVFNTQSESVCLCGLQTDMEELMAKWQREWKELSFDVNEIYIISRVGANNTPFDIRYAIPLQPHPLDDAAGLLPPPSFPCHPIEGDELVPVTSSTRVLISNVPFEVTEEELTEKLEVLAQRLGISIESVKIIRKPKLSARFCFHTFPSQGNVALLKPIHPSRIKKSSTGRAFVELRTEADQAALLKETLVLGDRTLVLSQAQA